MAGMATGWPMIQRGFGRPDALGDFGSQTPCQDGVSRRIGPRGWRFHVDEGITKGCNPPENSRFCPSEEFHQGSDDSVSPPYGPTQVRRGPSSPV
jgi:hypothetical protein